ncbi:MAG: hypothetical protein H6622_17485 [Halobacteriovoraceae bacterium]|nr:hypothetical protein [Halobacteriovoraceae bacterium]
MSLTTPENFEDLTVVSVEGIFLYWKTSSSLWKTKLETLHKDKYVIIPLNWGFHCDRTQIPEFGETRPETDLLKLFNIIVELGKIPILLLPIGPCPLQVNGGVPSSLANHLLHDDLGMNVFCIDNQDRLIKLYSFFESKVYIGYKEFLGSLAKYLKKHKLNLSIWGLNSGYFNEEGVFCSFFKDTSNIYQTSFSRFLTQQQVNNASELTKEGKEKLEEDFYHMMFELYSSSIEEILSEYWEGVLNISFMGTGPHSTITRMEYNDSSHRYSKEIFYSISTGVKVCSATLSHRVFNSILNKQIEDLSKKEMIGEIESLASYEEDDLTALRTLHFFYMYSDNLGNFDQSWIDSGLIEYFEKEFKCCHRNMNIDLFNPEIVVDRPGTYHFFLGKDVRQKNFYKIMRGPMNGGKIIIDTQNLSKDIRKNIEIFILENELNVTKVRLFCDIEYIEFGDGRLILFDSSEIPKDKLSTFWEKLISTFDILHLQFDKENQVDKVWQYRGTGPSELSYQEIRRVTLYNDTSYKKKVRIPMMRGFALMKLVDEQNVKVTSQEDHIDLNFLPKSIISLDFGVFL